MIGGYRHLISTWMVIVLAMLSAAFGQETTSPGVTWPAAGIIDPEEGTMEAWVKLEFEPLEEHQARYVGHGSLFFCRMADPAFAQDGIAVAFQTINAGRHGQTDMHCVVAYGITFGGEKLTPRVYGDFGPKAQRGQWRHVAITWSRQQRRLTAYVDGKIAPDGGLRDLDPQMTWTPLLFSRTTFGIGWPAPSSNREPSRIAIDEVRISSIERSVQQLTCSTPGPATADLHTRFLLDFDAADTPATAVQPTMAAVQEAAQAQPLPSGWRWVEGRNGRGLAMFTQENQ